MLRLLVPLLLAPALALAQTRADPEAATGFAPKPLASAERHMIVTAHPLATEAGLEMLRAGGSAADAMIAAQLVLGVVEPQSSGLGGGAFALVLDRGVLTSWDAREIAPAGATPGMFLASDGGMMTFLGAVASGRSVGVPGVPRLLEVLHERHGTLPWADLFAPAIRLAEEGFTVSPRLAGSISSYAERLATTQSAALFLHHDGTPLAEGETMRRPALAATMRAIAEGGADAFYSGDIAASIVAAVAAEPVPGSMTAEDLASYEVIDRAPVCMEYREAWLVCSMGPPSSGATTVGQMLGLLNNFPAPQSAADPTFWHLFGEASRLAYADRAAYLADADFVAVPVAGLLDPVYLTNRAGLIDPKRAGGKATAGTPPWREGRLRRSPDPSLVEHGTSHISVIDSSGMAISLTTSVESAFGSGRVASGVLLNNQLTDFSFVPIRDGRPVANAVAPGKRPRSSMAPTVVLEKESRLLVALTGSPGGSRIPEYVAGSLIGLLDLGLDPAAAAALTHVSHRNRDALALEEGFDPALGEALTSLGHAIEQQPMTSGLHIVVVTPEGRILGGADPRREGIAAGD